MEDKDMITKKLVNKIGLECEVLIRNNKDELVIPSEYNLPTDDFIILGEIRSLPQTNVSDVVYEFMKDLYAFNILLKVNKLNLDIQDGWDVISPDLYSKLLRIMGSKNIEECKNVYGNDILKMTDAIVENGKIIGHKISTGLHIHFSYDIIASHKYAKETYTNTVDNMYVRTGTETCEEETKLYSLLTENTIKSIVKSFDKDILPKYKIEENLKFRNSGFYEIKPYGFEYRSLPFNQLILDNLTEIVEYSFDKLNKLSKVLV
jgi:hypothetical protein